MKVKFGAKTKKFLNFFRFHAALIRRRDIQHNDTWHNDTRHYDIKKECDVGIIYTSAVNVSYCGMSERRSAECRWVECCGATQPPDMVLF